MGSGEREFYSTIYALSSIAGEFTELVESDFATANGAAYIPPENEGEFRRVNVARTIQLLKNASLSYKTSHTNPGSKLRMPCGLLTANDALDGRPFIIWNAGTSDLSIENYAGSVLRVLKPNQTCIAFHTENDYWQVVFSAKDIKFDNTINGFTATDVQEAIEEVAAKAASFATPVSIGLNNAPGSATTLVRSDHVHRIDNLTYTSHSPRAVITTSIVNGSLVLTNLSNYEHVVHGTATGFKYVLPDATTLTNGWKFEIYNRSAVPVSIVYNDLTTLYQIAAAGYAVVTLEDNSSNDGTWIVVASNLADIDLSNPDFTGVKDGFEDFMFDAYAGAGGNDNQYSFTRTANNGYSDIDGAVTVVGNDYEGIHILDSLAVANSRPMVESFNLINRIKLGAQPESYEIRVRIETLADINQKFTCRYGLMDTNAVGRPPNAVDFIYDPVYPVTPVRQVVTATPNISSNNPSQHFIETINGTPYDYLYAVQQTVTATPNSFPQAAYQVVTATPDVTSHAPTQHFIQTVNGINYDYTYLTNQIITVTPNSFPQATYQQISVTWARANNRLYQVTINGTTCSYTSDASATDAEIAAGLGAAINAAVGSVVTAGTTGKPILVTSNILGTGFTYSGNANVTIALVTANVPKEVYTETIAGVNYVFTSDGAPTAAKVVTGLTALVNADAGCPATASGTTTLILTDKNPPGDTWTYSGSANLTQADTTANPTALGVCNGLRALMASDTAVNVSGTTTLIMTAKVLGTAFTYSGTSNLTEVLTTANVPKEIYTQTIAGVNYVFTSDGAPTASKVVTGLIALINADAGCPATASGTTVLLMTGKVVGASWTYSGSANLTEALTTPYPTALGVCNGLRALIASDPVVTASGTTTLILTGAANGAPFTYSGSTNLPNVLTTPNTPEVLYSGNWIAGIVNNSTATIINTGISVVAGRWYRLKVVIKADGTGAYFYVDSLFVGEIVAQVPLVALRFIFKLEKTLGTTSRTTSIDYLTWRRTRG